jgi:hypothetical protein
MALSHAPSIITNGLVYYHDMGNTKKSFFGQPTTNYIPYPYASYNAGAFVLGYNYPNLGATYTYRPGVVNPVNAPGVMEYFTGTTGYKYFSVDSTTVPTTGTYNFSYYARIVAGPTGSSNIGLSQLWRANGVDQAVTGDWNPTFTTDWVRYSTQGPVTAGTILQYFLVHSGTITGGYTIQYCGFQLELASSASPFVAGTRSTTNNLIDLTNNNTLTASSLVYNANGTYSFNGSTNYIDCGNATALQQSAAITMAAWVNPTSWAGLGNIMAKNGNSGYRFRLDSTAGALWWYVSGNSIQGGAAPLNTWSYCVVTGNSSGLKAYINGVLVASNSTAFTPTTPSGGNMYIGSIGGSEYFQGQIAITSMYNRALIQAEITQNFNALRGRFGL